MKSLEPLVAMLSDGELYSGEQIAASLGVSRAAVWKKIQKLQAQGLAIETVKGSGYRLPHPVELLSPQRITDAVTEVVGDDVPVTVSVVDVTGSTNEDLLQESKSRDIHGVALLAECQTAGKGRRGREWISPPYTNLYLSIGWNYEVGASALEGLSLVIGVEVAEALQSLLAPTVESEQIKVKWPNDLLVGGRKLGGILIEISGDITGGCTVVVGVGINLSLGELSRSQINQAAISLSELQNALSRNEVAIAVLSGILRGLSAFDAEGFTGYLKRWDVVDACSGLEVKLMMGDQVVHGSVLGVTESGALRLETDGEESIWHGGEVSLRLDT